MDTLIQSSLFQNETCILPGVGTLSIISGTAETDFANSTIKPPLQNIVFKEENELNLINKFSDQSDLIKLQLHQSGNYYLDGVGTFTKDNEHINFTSVSLPRALILPVKAERVIRQELEQAEHPILVGDKQTTNHAMTNYLNEEEIKQPQQKKDKWWIWAIGLTVIAAATIIFYFSGHTNFSFGNSSIINAAPANTATHHLIK